MMNLKINSFSSQMKPHSLTYSPDAATDPQKPDTEKTQQAFPDPSFPRFCEPLLLFMKSPGHF